jgi:hypothetical protein
MTSGSNRPRLQWHQAKNDLSTYDHGVLPFSSAASRGVDMPHADRPRRLCSALSRSLGRAPSGYVRLACGTCLHFCVLLHVRARLAVRPNVASHYRRLGALLPGNLHTWSWRSKSNRCQFTIFTFTSLKRAYLFFRGVYLLMKVMISVFYGVY